MSDIQDSIDTLQSIYVWQLVTEHIFRGTTSMIVLFIVLFKRKRREIFFWSIPTLFMIDNILGLFPAIALLENGYDSQDHFARFPVELQLSNSAFLLAHWIFSV